MIGSVLTGKGGETVMKVLMLAILVLNVAAYAWVYFSWRIDCKEIGKDHLAVSLGERIRAAFLLVTLPCALGLATWK